MPTTLGMLGVVVVAVAAVAVWWVGVVAGFAVVAGFGVVVWAVAAAVRAARSVIEKSLKIIVISV